MSRRFQRPFAVAAATGALLLVAVLSVRPTREAVFRGLGHLLVVDDTLQASDTIVLPEWAGRAGALEAADLVHNGLSKRVAVLAEIHGAADRELDRRGVPFQNGAAQLASLLGALHVIDVETIPNAVTGTEAEGELLPIWCDQHRFDSIIVISSPDHSRRLRRVLHRSMQGHNTRVFVRFTHYSAFDADTWWQSRDGTRTAIVELEKLVLDVVRHPMS